MTDLTYAAVKASVRKGGLFTNQQLIDLASSRDLKDLLNRLKEKYPCLVNVPPSLVALEGALIKSYADEIDEFARAAQDISPILMMARREVQEWEAVDLLKVQLGIIPQETTEGQKRVSKEEALGRLSAGGFIREANEATRVYEKYKVPALIDSVFARARILRMMDEKLEMDDDVLEGLKEYLRLKVDFFNLDTLLRGIRNNIDHKALEELLIYRGGSLSSQLLKEALKQPDLDKVLSLLESAGLPKVDSPRALERVYEGRVSKMMSKTYYSGYVDTGAILGYLELRFREIKDIIRIANAVSRNIDPKRIAQDFIF